MTKEYLIEGMTCGGCVKHVKKSLEELPEVVSADIQLAEPQGKLVFKSPAGLEKLQEAIGDYSIREIVAAQIEKKGTPAKSNSFISTYKPLLMIVGFIAVISLIVQYPFSQFSGMIWMRHFMAGFFLAFAFFKLLNIKGFADSYAMYDIVADRWKGWGYIYPYVELTLGVLYLINIAPILTNALTIVVLGVSSVGVIKSNLDKRKIKCACLGDVFNLPMSTVTIVEDLSMVAMAGMMLLLM